MTSSATWRQRLTERLTRPVDAASIAFWRIAFGLILVWEVWRFFDHDWIRLYYIERDFHFKYYGFEWVKPLAGDGMYVLFLAVAFCALCFAAGFLYRLMSVAVFVGMTWWFLLDETRYLNHMYLVSLLAFLMMWIPAHRTRSLDARLRPSLRADTVPTWCLWLLRFQVGLVYFYAGVAKLTPDWLAAEPIATWLARRADYPLVGPWLATEAAGWLFAYGGLVFDLAVVPALLCKATRPWAFAACIAFHVSNMIMFDIGIFPPTMLVATTIFFEPDWPRRALLLFKPLDGPSATPAPPTRGAWLRHARVGVLGVYVALQVLVPLRHHLYPGSPHWTEEGHRFAWHMKLREKRADAAFRMYDPRTGESVEVDARHWLSSKQEDRVGRFPDMTVQFARFLREQWVAEGRDPDVEVRVHCEASLNGRPPQLFYDPEVDLSRVPRDLAHAEWVYPLKGESALLQRSLPVAAARER